MPFYPPKANLSVINAGTTYSGGVLNFTEGQINLSGSVAVFDAPALEITNGTISVYPNTLSITSNLATSEQSINNATLLYSTVFDLLSVVPLLGHSIRLLSSTYTGKCMNVRRSSDNAAMDIGFVNGLIDVSTLQSFCGAGNGFVTKWYNQGSLNASGDVLQSTAVKQPQIYLNGSIETWNNIPSVYFSGAQYLCTAGNIQIVNATTGAWFANGIFNVTGNTNFYPLISAQDNYSSSTRGPIDFQYLRYSNKPQIQSWNTSNQAFNAGSSINANLGTGTFAGSSGSNITNIYANGTLSATVILTGTPVEMPQIYSIGADAQGTSESYHNGTISELMAGGYVISSSDRSICELNQASFYNISGVV